MPIRPLAQVAKLQTAPSHEGDMISVSGFPLSIPVLVTTTGFIASSFYKDKRERAVYLADLSVNQGNSGAPAYNDTDGSVIGCVTDSIATAEGANSGLVDIVPVQRILDLLSQAKADEEAKQDAAQPKSPKN